MGSPPLTLGLLVNQELSRRLAPGALVGQDGIGSQQPVGQFSVTGGPVGNQQLLVVIHELFLEGAMESFDLRVHVRGARIGPPMDDTVFVETLLEGAEELRAVVGDEAAGWGGE